MPILNYTTTIKAERTAGEIQSMLAKAGAQAVLCDYDDVGEMRSMSFRIKTAFGVVSFRMPANTAGVLRVLQKNSKVPRRLKTHAQASNVAWRVLKDWIEAQLAIVEAEMADLAEVFLPYAQHPTGQTVFEGMKEAQFRTLQIGGSQ